MNWGGESFWEGRCHLIQDITGLKGCPRNALKTFGNPGADEGQGRAGNAAMGFTDDRLETAGATSGQTPGRARESQTGYLTRTHTRESAHGEEDRQSQG